MKFKEKTREEVEKELQSIKNSLLKIKFWEKEIKVIESNINAYSDTSMGFKSSKSFDLASIIENNQARLELLKSKIEYTNYKVSKFTALMNDSLELYPEEIELIHTKYLDRSIKSISFRALGGILNCSKTAAKRLHDSAIKKITKEIQKKERFGTIWNN